MNKKSKEQEQEEFNTLYKFLTGLVEKNKKQSDVKSDVKSNEQPIVNIVVTPDETKSIPNTDPGKDLFEKILYGDVIENEILKCDACCKTFTNNINLKAHHNSSELCKNWKSYPESVKNYKPEMAIHYFLDEVLRKITSNTDSLTCRYCKSSFTHRGNLNKHFIISIDCNKLAFYELKQTINKM